MRIKHKIITISVIAAITTCAVCTVLLMPQQAKKQLYAKMFPLTPAKERIFFSDISDRKVIKIGVPGPLDDIRETTRFLEGVEMAVNDCNSSGILSLPLETVISDDKNKMTDVLTIAGDYANNIDIVAVIGHWGSEYSMAAAQVYENAGIIMLTPVSTNPILTESGFRLVFRTAPTDNRIGAFLAEYAKAQGYRDIVALYSKDMTGIQVSRAFESHASSLGLHTLDKHGVYSNLDKLESDYKRWRESGMDAVMIADIITRNTEFQRKLIAQNKNLPLLATDAYDYTAPLAKLSELASSISIVTFFNPTERGEEYLAFCRAFQAIYGYDPDYWAVQGYNSVMTIARAIQHAGSLNAEEIAAVLRAQDSSFKSMTGNEIRFDKNGDAVSTDLYIKQIKNGVITYWKKGAGAFAWR